MVYAKWTAEKYTVSFNGNGQTITIGSQTVEYGKTAAEPTAPTITGLTFGGWFTDKACTAKFDFTAPITANTELFAKWTVITHTVSFNGNGKSINIAVQTVEHNNKAAEPAAPTAAEFTFGGWYTDKACVTPFDFNTLITADTVLYAKWTALQGYIVKFDNNGYGSEIEMQNIIGGNKAVKPADLSEKGYIFGGWYTDKACTAAFDFNAPITADIVLYAKWTAEKYIVSFDGNGQTITIGSQTVEYGNKAAEPTAPTITGLTFGGWFTDKACTAKFDFTAPITANTELFAKWTVITHTVSFNTNGQPVTINSQKIEYGKAAAEPATPTLVGLALVGWYTDSTLTAKFDFSTPITADTELYAKWTAFYNVGDADGNGKVTATDAAIVFEYAVSGYKSVLPIKDKYADYISIIDIYGDKIITANDSDLILEKARKFDVKI